MTKKFPDEKEDDKRKMETQHADAKGELLLELREKTTSLTVKEFGPAGVRTEQNLQGEVTGRYKAKHNETVSILIKPDASFESEAKAIETTSDGEIVLMTATGSGQIEAFPILRFSGDGTYQSPSKKLAWLNTTTARLEGTYNLNTNELTAKIYAMK